MNFRNEDLNEYLKNVSANLTLLYNDQMKQINPNVKQWPLMDALLPTIYFSLVYLLVVIVLSFFMRFFNAFHLKFLIFCYNVFSICVNVYISSTIIYLKYKAKDFDLCTTIESTGTPYSLEMNQIIWWFYVIKGLEFLDTVFFILRKKFYKISFLHIFNHATMFPIWWMCTAFFANGTSGLAALINSIIHIIMYYYYIVSTIGPRYQKWIWWKKYIVQMQMLQFCILIVFCSLLLHKNCANTNDRMIWFVIYYSLIHIALIYDFYTKSYYKIMAKNLDESKKLLKLDDSTPTRTNSLSANTDSALRVSRRRPLHDQF